MKDAGEGEVETLPQTGLSLVVVAYNEEEALPLCVREAIEVLTPLTRQLELIIVDDGSTDGTWGQAQILAEQYPHQLRLAQLPENRGMGAALKVGYRAATQPWVSFLHGDGQIAAEELLELFTLAPQADFITSRYHNQRRPLHRAILSHGLRFLTLMVLGGRPQTEGIYLFRRSLLEQLPLRSDSFLLNLEFPLRVQRAGISFRVARIALRARLAGESKATTEGRIWKTFRDLWALRRQLQRP